MMEITLFGIGAAGNKAAIAALEKGVIDKDHTFMLNTTLKDIPTKYKENNNNVTKFSSMLGGCGKEPKKGRTAMIQAIKTGAVDFSSMVTPTTKAAVVVTSIEGGTGSGSTPVIVQYFDAMNLPVHVFAFVGFQDEARGINNSLQFFKSLGNNVILHTIQNEKFLDYTQSYTKAEAAANEEFANQLQILIGANMIPSSQNIDDTDHYKILTTPGYTDIQHIDLSKLKNTEMVNNAIIEKFDNLTCLDYSKGCKQLAVIINASERTQDAIDNSFSVIKRYTGEPFETYRHIQTNTVDRNEYMDIIVTGLAFPEQGIIDMNAKYSDLKAKLDTGVKGFDDIFGDIDFDDDDDGFDTDIRQINNPADAKSKFAQMFSEAAATSTPYEPKQPNKKVTTTRVIKNVDSNGEVDEY